MIIKNRGMIFSNVKETQLNCVCIQGNKMIKETNRGMIFSWYHTYT